MNNDENKMYSNLANLLNESLKNGEIPQNKNQEEEILDKNLNSNQKIENTKEEQKNTIKVRIKKNKTIKNTQNYYTILHKYTENMQFPLNIQNALTTLDIVYPFTKFQLKQKYRKLCKEYHPDKKSKQTDVKITIQTSNFVYNSILLDINMITEAYSALLKFFFNE